MYEKIFLSVLFSTSLSVQAASFDCTKATTAHEKIICTTPSLSELDEKLANTYKSALTTAKDANQVKLDQRAWLKDAVTCRSDVACLERAYVARINQLAPNPVPQPNPMKVVETSPVTPQTAPQEAASEAPAASVPVEPASTATPAAEQSIPPQTASPPVSDPEQFWEKAYVKYGAMAFGLIVALFLMVWLVKKMVAGAKKGAVLVAQKGDQLRQDLTDKAVQAREAATEKTSKFASEMAAKTKEATASASIKLKEGLNETAEKSAPHLQTLKADLADMKSKASQEWAATDVTAKQKTMNIWAGFSSRQKIIFAVSSLVIISIIGSLSGNGSGGASGGIPSKNFSDPAFIQNYANRLGPDGYAECAVANILIGGLATRTDGGVPKDFASANEGLGIVLSKVRFVLLGRNLPQSYLDGLFKAYSFRIPNGDEAARIVDKCIRIADSV